MSYYQRPMGDYGTGGYGYPQGDPGLFSFLAMAVPKVIKFFKKPAVKAVVAAAAGAGAVEAGSQMMAPGPGIMPTGPMAPPGAGFPGVGLPMLPGPGVARGGGAYMGGACPAGYHPDKRTGTRCVRNRRMNIANPRALRRSMRRVKGFEKLARKTISFTKRVRIKT